MRGGPADYVFSMVLQNAVFKDDLRFEGIVQGFVEAGLPPQVVISQTFYKGVPATESQIAEGLTKRGFRRVGRELAGVWNHPELGVNVYDAGPSNVARTADGALYFFDVDVTPVDGVSVAQVLEKLRVSPLATPVSGSNIEVAPNPSNKDAVERWGHLANDQKFTATRNVGPTVLNRLASDMKMPQPDIEAAVGGFEGEANPTMIVRFPERVTFEQRREFTTAAGVLLRQNSVIAFDEGDTTNGGQGFFVKLIPSRPLTFDERAEIFQAIYGAYPQAAGFTGTEDSLVFGNFSNDSNEVFQNGIEQSLPDVVKDKDYSMETAGFTFRSEYIETENRETALENTRYGHSNTQRTEAGGTLLPGRGRSIDSLQAFADTTLKTELDRLLGESRESGGSSPTAHDTRQDPVAAIISTPAHQQAASILPTQYTAEDRKESEAFKRARLAPGALPKNVRDRLESRTYLAWTERENMDKVHDYIQYEHGNDPVSAFQGVRHSNTLTPEQKPLAQSVALDKLNGLIRDIEALPATQIANKRLLLDGYKREAENMAHDIAEQGTNAAQILRVFRQIADVFAPANYVSLYRKPVEKKQKDALTGKAGVESILLELEKSRAEARNVTMEKIKEILDVAFGAKIPTIPGSVP